MLMLHLTEKLEGYINLKMKPGRHVLKTFMLNQLFFCWNPRYWYEWKFHTHALLHYFGLIQDSADRYQTSVLFKAFWELCRHVTTGIAFAILLCAIIARMLWPVPETEHRIKRYSQELMLTWWLCTWEIVFYSRNIFTFKFYCIHIY
jgi:hypothetical protein